MLLKGNCDSKNYAQPHEYGGLAEWLREYFFGKCGTSGFMNTLENDKWLEGSETNSLAIWIFWLFSQMVSFSLLLFAHPACLTLIVCFFFSSSLSCFHVVDYI